jgi:hypothetical protein
MVYRKLRTDSAGVRNMMAFPEFRNRNIEIRLLGGLASLKISGKSENPMPAPGTLIDQDDLPRLENSINHTERKITELNALFEKNLITRDDFQTAKQKILQG